MTDLAVRCALLEIAVDPGRLYEADGMFIDWLSWVADRVNDEKRKQEEAAKAKTKS